MKAELHLHLSLPHWDLTLSLTIACKVHTSSTRVIAGPHRYVLPSELLKLMHWKQSYVFTCPCHVEIHVACLGSLAMSPTRLWMSQNRVCISKSMCLGVSYCGACLGLNFPIRHEATFPQYLVNKLCPGQLLKVDKKIDWPTGHPLLLIAPLCVILCVCIVSD